MVAQLWEYNKDYWIVHLKWMNVMVCKSYLNKAIKMKKLEV